MTLAGRSLTQSQYGFKPAPAPSMPLPMASEGWSDCRRFKTGSEPHCHGSWADAMIPSMPFKDLEPGQRPVLASALLLLVGFTAYFVWRGNREFIIYIGVIVGYLALILATRRRVHYPIDVLWGFLIWAILHMLGGSVYVGQTRLYELLLLPLSRDLPILRYDQAVHIFGFAVTTLLAVALLRPYLVSGLRPGRDLALVVVMAGLGFGALNEIIEYGVTLVVPDSGVGDYQNTSLDLVADLVGAVAAWLWVRRRWPEGQAAD